MGEHKKLLVWQKAHKLALHSNRVGTSIRGTAHSALRNQIVRAALSIPTNIVEGRAQKGEREFARFLGYAAASAAELDYHLLAGHEIGVIRKPDYSSLTDQLTEVRKMLRALITRLQIANG